ncbi:hypothetical protein THUN1379_17030 [Paludibacterium sp. THUN1379]|uniref:hypothetical protein n=1 Tax=Paludibacterium sp. THUN1379 TaxID=3112107 RepID=UPI00309171B8|nr:hypothetical protein THUN1379_17030 [Paludibacterium sp. THUN1379]
MKRQAAVADVAQAASGPLIIGIDFDNTIACYDQAFARVACAMGLLDEASGLDKAQVRQRVREQAGEQAWMRLQGLVYGREIGLASVFPGFDQFVQRARQEGAVLRIISHKSRYGHFDPEQVDLRQAAMDWMQQRGFFAPDGLGFVAGDVSFHDERGEKLAAIARQGCRVFIDDLPEVLLDGAFPPDCRALWFAPGNRQHPPLTALPSWAMLSDVLWPAAT